MALTFRKIEKSETELIEKLAVVASEIWHEYYPGIITPAQVDYMVDEFQSAQAVQEQISNNNYEYFLFLDDESIIGYFALKEEPGSLFLSKLYLAKEHRGLGYFNTMLLVIEQLALDRHIRRLYLTVNRHNNQSIDVYKKKGFVILKEQKVYIGGGYVMDDYVMEKTL